MKGHVLLAVVAALIATAPAMAYRESYVYREIGPNLLSDWSFEAGASAWTRDERAPGCAGESDGTWRWSGSVSWRLTRLDLTRDCSLTQTVPIAPGEGVVGRVATRSVLGGAGLSVSFLDADGAQLGPTAYDEGALAGATSILEAHAVAPPGAAFARLGLHTTAAIEVLVDDAVLARESSGHVYALTNGGFEAGDAHWDRSGTTGSACSHGVTDAWTAEGANAFHLKRAAGTCSIAQSFVRAYGKLYTLHATVNVVDGAPLLRMRCVDLSGTSHASTSWRAPAAGVHDVSLALQAPPPWCTMEAALILDGAGEAFLDRATMTYAN